MKTLIRAEENKQRGRMRPAGRQFDMPDLNGQQKNEYCPLMTNNCIIRTLMYTFKKIEFYTFDGNTCIISICFLPINRLVRPEVKGNKQIRGKSENLDSWHIFIEINLQLQSNSVITNSVITSTQL